MTCASNSQGSLSPVQTPTQVIQDPEALERFIQLLGQKKKLEEDHANASIASKELEWALQWKRWKLEAAKFAGKLTSAASHRDAQQMLHQYNNYLSKHKTLAAKATLAKQILDFNEKEIDLIGDNCFNKLTMEDPFLTLTLREFLYYKSLEREVSAHKSLENYHQKMSLTIFKELLNSETMLGNTLKFHNYIYDCLQDRDGITEYIEAKHNEVLSPLYGGEISLKVSSTDLDQLDFPPTYLLQSLWDLMRSPVIEYESNTEGDTWENNHADCEHEGSSENLRSKLHQLPHHQPMPIREPDHDTLRSPVHTPSLENSSVAGTRTSSSNDIFTIHRPTQFVSVESLLDRGVTARTVPFSAVPSEESAVTDEAKTRATTATDFEEAIKYSNSNLLEYIDAKMKREAKKINRANKSSNNNNNNASSRPTTTTVTKNLVPPFFGPTVHMQPQQHQHQHQHQNQPWLQNHPEMSIPPIDNNNAYYCHRGGVSVLGAHDSRPFIYDNAQVQVSEADLLGTNAERPLTFCYPNNYSNSNSVYPFYPGQGDR